MNERLFPQRAEAEAEVSRGGMKHEEEERPASTRRVLVAAAILAEIGSGTIGVIVAYR
jgi:hypothetical protein